MQQDSIFSILDTVDSTNNYAMKLVHAGVAKHGITFFAINQTDGKGQRANQWMSEPGANITMSTVLQMQMPIENQFLLSAAVACVTADFAYDITGVPFTIKWPNDLFWQDRKAGGILIENTIGANWKWSVVGIGINVNQHFSNSPLHRAASFYTITGSQYNPIALGRLLQQRLLQLAMPISKNIIAAYNERLYMRNKRVQLKKHNTILEATVVGVDEFGGLHTLEHPPFQFGEVTWLLGE